MSVSFTVYEGHDNVETLFVFSDEVLISSLAYVTKVELIIGGVTVDSDTAPANTVWWDDSVTVTQAMVDDEPLLTANLGDSVNVLRLQLGNLTTLEEGTHTGSCIILYDATNTDGVVWTDSAKIKVKAGCAA